MTALDDVKPGAVIRSVVPFGPDRFGRLDRQPGNQPCLSRAGRRGFGNHALPRRRESPGHRDAWPELVVRRRRQPVTLGKESEPDHARASLRSPTRHSHQPGRSIAATDLRRLWRDASASTAALPADRRSGGGEARIPVRSALLNYAFKRLGLDTTDPSARCPQDQQVILLNRDSVIATKTPDIAEGSR